MKIKGVTQASGRYYKIVQSGDRDARGKLKRQWIPLSLVTEGNRALMEALDALNQAPAPGRMPQAVADYLKHHLPTLTPAVRKEHERMFDKVAGAFADFGVDQVRPKHCLQFLRAFDASPSARQHYKYRLSAFFGWCVVQELCETNPLREITVAHPASKKTPWTDALFVAVGKQLDPMLRAYHEFSYLCWQRTTDIRLLERKQLDGNVIHFAPSKTAGSTAATVDVRITSEMRRVLASAAEVTLRHGRGSVYVFHTSTGDAFTRSGIYSAYRRADITIHGQATGLSPKSIRAYAATRAEAQGISLREIQRRLAHASQGTTEGYIQRHDTPISDIDMRLPE